MRLHSYVYHFDGSWVDHAIDTVSDYSCVADRNATSYHRGLISDDGSFLESNLKAAVIGYLGEVAYCQHYKIEHDNEGHNANGDGGYDFVVDGFRVDVKTRGTVLPQGDPSAIVGYIRSVMATGKPIDITKADAYFFACLDEAPRLDHVAIRLLGGIETIEVVKMPDVESPIKMCRHKNKVVRANDLSIYTLEDFWR